MVMQKRIKRKWSFSRLATMIRIMLMYYVNLYTFLEDPEKDWAKLLSEANLPAGNRGGMANGPDQHTTGAKRPDLPLSFGAFRGALPAYVALHLIWVTRGKGITFG